MSKYAQEFRRRRDNPLQVAPPGGETTLRVQERVLSVLNNILMKHPEEIVAIVSHGFVIAVARTYFTGKPIEEVLTKEQLDNAVVLTVEQTNTCVFVNDGKGQFSMQALPVRAQLSPVFAIAQVAITGSANKGLYLVGNFFGFKPQTGRFDANYGTILMNDPKRGFRLHTGVKSSWRFKIRKSEIRRQSWQRYS